MEIPEFTKNHRLLQSDYIKRHYSEFYNYINNRYSNINKWMEKLYLYYNNLEEPPKCTNPDCNKPTKFISLYEGYRHYCSHYCSDHDPITQEKMKQTNLERYGVEHPMYSDKIKEKMKQTNLERYGVEYITQSKEVQNKIKQTNIKKYGVENPMQSEEIHNKVKKTNLERYGVENPFSNKEIQEKMKQTLFDRYGVEHALQNKEIYKKSCQTLLKNYGVERACDLIANISKTEIELQDYIEQLDYQIVRNTRDIIKGYELDIYIPNLNIAIEYNGSYWHSIINKEPKYHMNKWKACYSAGIELISIWEPWNTNIVYQFIKDKLKGSDITIYKSLIFPNLEEWPLDLGYPSFDININNIKEHKCIYNGFECYDSGIVKTL